MPKGPSKSTVIIQRLLEERRQYEAWLARLNDSADATPGQVRARIRSDYEARLTAVTEELKAHAESARLAIEEKRYLRGELQKKEARAAEKLTETELRHAVGEYDESQWEQVHKDVLAELISVREDLQAVEVDIQKLQELDALVSQRPVPPPRTAPPSPHREPPAKPEKVGAEDELAFIKSVTEDDKDTAPSPKRASGAQFQPAPLNPLLPSTPTPEAPDEEVDEEQRTLKCKACGTMNLPTEWYCEQCGGELASM